MGASFPSKPLLVAVETSLHRTIVMRQPAGRATRDHYVRMWTHGTHDHATRSSEKGSAADFAACILKRSPPLHLQLSCSARRCASPRAPQPTNNTAKASRLRQLPGPSRPPIYACSLSNTRSHGRQASTDLEETLKGHRRRRLEATATLIRRRRTALPHRDFPVYHLYVRRDTDRIVLLGRKEHFHEHAPRPGAHGSPRGLRRGSGMQNAAAGPVPAGRLEPRGWRLHPLRPSVVHDAGPQLR